MSDCVLSLQNIVKDFPGVRALDHVSLEVFSGEVLGLIGENGAGKSTLLKIVNGIYKHGSYEGQVFVNEKEARFYSPHDALLSGIGFVPQEINVMDDLTVAENIFVGRLAEQKVSLNISHGKLYKRAEEFLVQNKISLDPQIRVRMLSIAQKQMLMIARAIAWDPHILILDEPTTALAADDVENLFHTVETFKTKGRSVIFVTHKLDEIVKITDRVSVLRDGKSICTYGKEDYQVEKLVADMVGRTIDNLFPKRNAQIGGEILRVRELSVDHPRIQNKKLLKNVSFDLKKGEILGLVGLVGSGRTEILETLFGLNKIAAGKVFVEKKEVIVGSAPEAISLGINLVTEDRKQNGLMMLANIRQNVVISNLKKICRGFVIDKKLEHKVANEFMEKLSIKAPSYETMVVNLSGGNQQKVVVSKTLNTMPKILLLDEPTKGIDVGSKNEMYHLINTLADSGIGIIMVSSELPELLGMCDRFVIIANGTSVAEMSAEEATQESVMAKCFEAL